MENQLKLDDERVKLVEKLTEAIPDLMDKEFAVLGEIYKDGALSHKVKRLIALAIGLRVGCINCILHHTIEALEAGATKDEILETISVEMAMTGTSGVGESLRVIKILEEKGVW